MIEVDTTATLIRWVVGFVAGAVVSAGIWVALRDTFDQPLFARTNHRGAPVPVGAGIAAVLAAIAVTGVWRFVEVTLDWVDPGAGARALVLVLATGFGLLGLFDDVAASGDERGFRGHLAALARGRLTTGGVKLLVGGLLALAVTPVTLVGDAAWWRLLLGAAVIALAANTANLFDRAPARCTKVVLVATVLLCVTAGTVDRPLLTGVLVCIGAVTGLVVFDAREQLMLGDAGSNVAGAVLGWGLVLTTDWVAQAVVLVVLVGLNLASEKVSFSKVIDSVGVLRAIDRLGRR